MIRPGLLPLILVAAMWTAPAGAQSPDMLDVTVVLDGQPFAARLAVGSSLVAHSEPVPIAELPEGVKRIPKRDRCFPARQLVATLEMVEHGQAVFALQLRNDAGEFRCEATDTLGEVWTTPTLTMSLGATGTIRQSAEQTDGYDLLEVAITAAVPEEPAPAAVSDERPPRSD
jgi:hypothetical protein